MTRYDEDWVAELASAVDGADDDGTEALLLLYVVTDTEDGKVAFNLSFEGGRCVAAQRPEIARFRHGVGVLDMRGNGSLVGVRAVKQFTDGFVYAPEVAVQPALEFALGKLRCLTQ